MLAIDSGILCEDESAKKVVTPLCIPQLEAVAFIQFGQNEMVMPVSRFSLEIHYLLLLFKNFRGLPHAMDDLDGGLVIFAPSVDCFTKREYGALTRHNDAIGWLGFGSDHEQVYFTFSRLSLTESLKKRSLYATLGLPVCLMQVFKDELGWLLNLSDEIKASTKQGRDKSRKSVTLLFCDFNLFHIRKGHNGQDVKKREFVLLTYTPGLPMYSKMDEHRQGVERARRTLWDGMKTGVAAKVL